MSKYDTLKFLKETVARIPHVCDGCGVAIMKGEKYYRESIGKVNAPHVELRKLCKHCFDEGSTP